MGKLLFILVFTTISAAAKAAVINTVFGKVDEKNPAILELIKSDTMQRLKYIDQSGPNAYFIANFPKYSRYDHSIGVYALLKKYNLSSREQIAGLLHDASHTVFSHIADIVFQSGQNRTESYQDNIHDWYLKSMHVDNILQKYNLEISDISPKNPEFLGLEQPYPDMNADRIEYNLHTALILGDLNNQEVNEILESLQFKKNKWYFTNINNAKKFAKLSTYYTTSFWSSGRNCAIYAVTSAIIKYSINNNIITKNDMHFGKDEEVVAKINNSTDPTIIALCKILQNIDAHFTTNSKNDIHVFVPVKMRGIDPLVLKNGELRRLSELSFDFKCDLENTKQFTQKGISLNFINIPDASILDLIKSSNT